MTHKFKYIFIFMYRFKVYFQDTKIPSLLIQEATY